MLNSKTIAAVIPAYNEELQIGKVIDSMPNFVDRIIIVNDNSKDRTADKVKSYIDKTAPSDLTIVNRLKNRPETTTYNTADLVVFDNDVNEKKLFTPNEIYTLHCEDKSSIILINHKKNRGVGAAIATGYKWCKDHEIDCTAVMAGDGQMDPDELQSICNPIVEEGIDYVKGNRLIHKSAIHHIPKIRFLGNSILSILTKIASGYWHVSDTQTGYTAISLAALKSIRIHKIYRSYGMPNDLLVKLNISFCTLREVEIKPVYRIGEKSKMKVFKVIPRVSWLLLKSFVKRLWVKYLFRDFHPLFILYNFSFILGAIALRFGVKIIYVKYFTERIVNPATLIAFVFLFISAFQSVLFAMWMDIQDNERLNK